MTRLKPTNDTFMSINPAGIILTVNTLNGEAPDAVAIGFLKREGATRRDQAQRRPHHLLVASNGGDDIAQVNEVEAFGRQVVGKDAAGAEGYVGEPETIRPGPRGGKTELLDIDAEHPPRRAHPGGQKVGDAARAATQIEARHARLDANAVEHDRRFVAQRLGLNTQPFDLRRTGNERIFVVAHGHGASQRFLRARCGLMTAGLGGRSEHKMAAAIRAINGAVFADVEKHLWVTEGATATVTGNSVASTSRVFGGLRGNWNVSLRRLFIEAA